MSSAELKQEEEQKKEETAVDKETKNQTQEVIADGQYPIMGQGTVSAEEMADYFHESGKAYPAEQLAKGGADSIETFCRIYIEEAEAEGVRPEVAFAQTMKETGFFNTEEMHRSNSLILPVSERQAAVYREIHIRMYGRE